MISWKTITYLRDRDQISLNFEGYYAQKTLVVPLITLLLICLGWNIDPLSLNFRKKSKSIPLKRPKGRQDRRRSPLSTVPTVTHGNKIREKREGSGISTTSEALYD